MKSWRTSRILLVIICAAVLGLTIFGLLAARVTSWLKVDELQAKKHFEAIIEIFPSDSPRLTRDGSGRFTNTGLTTQEAGIAPKKLGVLAYSARENRLLRSDIPFWFFRLKGPAAQLALRGSGFDMKRLGITPADIARQGAGIILDETSASGDRLLVWAE